MYCNLEEGGGRNKKKEGILSRKGGMKEGLLEFCLRMCKLDTDIKKRSKGAKEKGNVGTRSQNGRTAPSRGDTLLGSGLNKSKTPTGVRHGMHGVA